MLLSPFKRCKRARLCLRSQLYLLSLRAKHQILRIIYRVNYGSPRVPNSWRDMLSTLSVVAFILLPAVLESSRYQATPGKMLSGIIVTNSRGGKIGFGRALARNFLKTLSLFFLFPFIPIVFPGRKRGLHDMMTGCVVVVKEPKQVAPVAPQPVQQIQSQPTTDVTALPVESDKTQETQPKDKNWLYL